MRFDVRKFKNEDGQAIVLVALAMSVFLLAAVGLAVDGAHLYAQRQMAQTAADAAAQAGISSIFAGTATFSTTSSFTCTTTDTSSPCKYAASNGFGTTAADTVVIDYPGAAGAPGVNLAPDFPTTVLRATVTRSVNTTLMSLLGPTASSITATATAAIVNVVAPVPILVIHPTLAGSFSLTGGPTVTICGGPHRSIQVNSSSDQGSDNKKTDAFTINSNSAQIDLSHAGPPDPGDCSTGTGSDFGVWGGPKTSPTQTTNFNPGTTGHYLPASSPIPDPLLSVNPPSPVPPAAAATKAIANGGQDCPIGTKAGRPCVLYSPGAYAAGITADGSTAIMKPGIYYIQSGGVTCNANCDMKMGTGYTDAATGWTSNVMFYNTGPIDKKTGLANAGPFQLGANGNINLTGSPAGSAYKGILLFQDRNSVALNSANKPSNAHSLGGGGGMTLVGTLYFTNTADKISNNAAHPYQEVDLQGNPGSATEVDGEIIVDVLQLGGNAGIKMNLNSTASLQVDEIALVN